MGGGKSQDTISIISSEVCLNNHQFEDHWQETAASLPYEMGSDVVTMGSLGAGMVCDKYVDNSIE